jgi:hypothetical protein
MKLATCFTEPPRRSAVTGGHLPLGWWPFTKLAPSEVSDRAAMVSDSGAHNSGAHNSGAHNSGAHNSGAHNSRVRNSRVRNSHIHS